MATIRAEHETQNRMILAQKAALDSIIRNLEALRSLGRDRETTASADSDMSPRDTPGPEAADPATSVPESDATAPPDMEVEEGEEESGSDPVPPGEEAGDDDIEMGEVEEPKNKGKKRREEELEEGEASDEASDESSVLSDVPEGI